MKPSLKNYVSALLIFFVLSVPLLSLIAVVPASAYSGYPTISIISVVPDTKVTIRTYNFPENDTFKVLMNKIGTKGLNGVLVDTVSSGSGGSFKLTFSIPASLQGKNQLAIRLQSTSGSGYYAYNWFYNKKVTYGTGGTYSSSNGYSGYPVIYIQNVNEDKNVTIKITNLPKNDDFKILINKFGTKGVNGVEVGNFSTGSSSTKTIKVKIPDSMKGKSTLAIRIQSTSGSGYYAYNWFSNK